MAPGQTGSSTSGETQQVGGLERPPPTPLPLLDRQLERLRDNASRFARAQMGERITWLQQLARGLFSVAEEMVLAGCRAKGIAADSPLAGEEWLAGPVVTLRNLQLLTESLQQIVASGVPGVEPTRVRELAHGGVAVQVTPHDGFDRVLFSGYSCETWLPKDVKSDGIAAEQAAFYQRRDDEGGVSLLLGAGNVAGIAPMDALTKMFVDGRVCLVKLSPVNDYLGPLLQRAFRPLVDEGYLAIAYGDAEVGAYLCKHAAVDDIHITGSHHTHDAIVWGPPGPEREERKRLGDPVCRKRISSELGNISPVLVVPGPYSDDELSSMAQSLAGMVTNNASFNCNAAKVLVLPKGWPRREALLSQLAQVLRTVPPRQAYYPGAQQRYHAHIADHDDVRRFGEGGAGSLPWTLLAGVDSTNAGQACFQQEPFCAILCETEVGSADPAEFLAAATQFANERLWGTLCATLFVHPRHEADPGLQPALDAALRELRYGTVALNVWPAMSFGFGVPPWGGHPSATLSDIQSGRGWVHNTLMFERVEKSVLKGPLRPLPKAFWYPGHRTLHRLGRKLASFELDPSYTKLPSLAFTALRA